MNLQAYDELVTALAERGIVKVDAIIDWVQTDEHLDAAFGAVAWWDSMPRDGDKAVTPGLLVWKLREGGLPGYKRDEERREVRGAKIINDELLGRIRSTCLAGGMTRLWVENNFRVVAEKVNLTPMALIDMVMGAEWEQTPPYPGAIYEWRSEWTRPKEDTYVEHQRYGWSVYNKRPKPSICARRHGESDWDWAVRFWNYEDPPQIAEWRRTAIELAHMTHEEQERIRERQAKRDKRLADLAADPEVARGRELIEQLRDRVEAEDDAVRDATFIAVGDLPDDELW